MSLTFAAGAGGAAGATRAWSLTLSIQVRMNFWKRSSFGVGAGAGAGSGSEDTGPCAGCLKGSLPQRAGGIAGSGEWSKERSGEWKQ